MNISFFITEKEDILTIVNILFYCLIIVACLIYSIPIIFVRRFRHKNNFLFLNLCLTSICCCIYWIVYYLMFRYARNTLFDNSTCTILYYLETVSVSEVIYSFIVVSIHRYFSIVYPTNQRYNSGQCFKMSIAIQWIAGLIIPLPLIARNLPVMIIDKG